MYHPSLPRAAEALLSAIEAGSVELLLATFHPSASVRDDKHEDVAHTARGWAEVTVRDAPRRGVRVVARSGTPAEPKLTVQIYSDGEGVEGTFLWGLRIRDHKITELRISPYRCPELPAAVGRLIDAVNSRDLRAIVDSFDSAALINDELVEYTGRDRLHAWADQNIIARKLALYVVRQTTQLERVVVTTHATGKFDMPGLASPLVLSLYFSVHAGKISQLIILQNQQS